jgi:uncharacterized protein (AIM24 family)
MQAVVVPLADGQEVQAEPGALLYMAGGVDMESRMSGGLLGGLRRLMAGESLFMTRFRGRGEGQVAFAAPYPGKLKQLDLSGTRSSAPPTGSTSASPSPSGSARGCSAARASSSRS